MTVAKASGRQHTPTACLGRKAAIAQELAAADGRVCTPVGSNQTGDGVSRERGNTPRWALFPFLFPPVRCLSSVALQNGWCARDRVYV